jgi:hypothetical protein
LDLDDIVSKPVLVHANSSLEYINFIPKYKQCSCVNYGCVTPSLELNGYILRQQWERYTRGVDRHKCMNIFRPRLEIVNHVLKNIKETDLCPYFGCFDDVIRINQSYPWPTENFCLPISFEKIPPVYVVPNITLTDGTVVQGRTRSIYLYQNHSLHEFPDFDTFTAMGYDLSMVKHLTDAETAVLPKGNGLPPISAV